MASNIKVEVMRTEMIKPSSPTPDHLRSLKLSLIDQFAPFYRTMAILFYPSTDISIERRFEILKRSLSHTLKKFYPIAGRLRDNLWVDCNDAGAELVLARVHSPASKFLENPDSEEMLKLVIPPNNEISKEEIFKSPLLVIQVSFFDCGATSICFRLSHKLGDGTTAVLFLKTWTAMAAKQDSSFTPQFTSSSLFPPSESLASSFTKHISHQNVKIKRLVFSGRAIAGLRKRVASESVPNPSRVEAVMALLWSALIPISPGSKTVLTPHVNLRKLVAAESPENNIGNVAWIYKSESHHDGPNDLKDLVASVRKGYEEFKASCETRMRMEGIRGLIEEMWSMKKSDDSMRFYAISSGCKFGLYELDFGWGKPSLVSINIPSRKDTVFMFDSKDGHGIEVWLSLSAQDMALFETNYKLLAFHYIDVIPSAM